MSERQEEFSENWDAPGEMSIVVQGGLFQGNLVETANHCQHWREIFPHAQIILSISVTDVLSGSIINGVMNKPSLVSKHLNDGHLQAALDAIIASCDIVAVSQGAMPLPPIKADSPKLNNMNLQIAAARNGLSLVNGKHTLRVRSDLVFLDRSFLEQYCRLSSLPRGDASVFVRRVLISSLFTLNPFTIERMPLHFSDWFNFGLTEDVVRLWDVPLIPFKDSVYYRTNKHATASNILERLFNSRLAVEQHVIFNCFKRYFEGLILEYHNDHTSIDLAMDILLDNFLICDLIQTKCVFAKYASSLFEPIMQIQCITSDDWRAMVNARDVDYRKTLADKISAARYYGTPSGRLGLPKTYAASQLTVIEGQFINGEIVAHRPNGVIFHGPYATFGAGRYLVRLEVTAVEGGGNLSVKVTADAGKRELSQIEFEMEPDCLPSIEVPFDVSEPKLAKLEVVCSTNELAGISISGITFLARVEDGRAEEIKVKEGFVGGKGLARFFR